MKDPIENKNDKGLYEWKENGVEIMAIIKENPHYEEVMFCISNEQRLPTMEEHMFMADKFWEKDEHLFVPLDRMIEKDIPTSRIVKFKV